MLLPTTSAALVLLASILLTISVTLSESKIDEKFYKTSIDRQAEESDADQGKRVSSATVVVAPPEHVRTAKSSDNGLRFGARRIKTKGVVLDDKVAVATSAADSSKQQHHQPISAAESRQVHAIQDLPRTLADHQLHDPSVHESEPEGPAIVIAHQRSRPDVDDDSVTEMSPSAAASSATARPDWSYMSYGQQSPALPVYQPQHQPSSSRSRQAYPSSGTSSSSGSLYQSPAYPLSHYSSHSPYTSSRSSGSSYGSSSSSSPGQPAAQSSSYSRSHSRKHHRSSSSSSPSSSPYTTSSSSDPSYDDSEADATSKPEDVAEEAAAPSIPEPTKPESMIQGVKQGQATARTYFYNSRWVPKSFAMPSSSQSDQQQGNSGFSSQETRQYNKVAEKDNQMLLVFAHSSKCNKTNDDALIMKLMLLLFVCFFVHMHVCS